MANKYDVFKCEDCDKVVMILNPGKGDLACCGSNMVKMPEQTADSSTEKHVPVIEKVDGGFNVIVGSTLHPMLDNHWIQWVELNVDGRRMFKELNPGEEAKANFSCDNNANSVSAREYCNLHGLWRGEL